MMSAHKTIKIAACVAILMAYPFILGEIHLPSFEAQAFDEIPEIDEISFHKQLNDNLAGFFEAQLGDWKMTREAAAPSRRRDESPPPTPLSEEQPLAMRDTSKEPAVRTIHEPATEPPPVVKIPRIVRQASFESRLADQQLALPRKLIRRIVWGGPFGEIHPAVHQQAAFDVGSKIVFPIDAVHPETHPPTPSPSGEEFPPRK